MGYNNPENHKHKKTPLENSCILHLASCLKRALTQLSENLHNYSDYPVNAVKRMHENRAKMFPVSSPDEGQNIELIYPKHVVKPGIAARYKALVDHLRNAV